VAAAAVLWFVLRADRHPGQVKLARLSADSTATVGFAGMFPAEDAEGLANPLGIAWDGEALYVAESDAGRIAIFDSEGGVIGTIGIVPGEEATVSYPSAIAVIEDGRLAVVDNASSRVLVVGTAPAEKARVLLTLGGKKNAPSQPTSVAYADGEFFVFDAALAAIRVYDRDGVQTRIIADDLEPPLSFAAGIAITSGRLYVTDSNGGRAVAIDPQTGELDRVFEDRYALPRDIVPLRDDELAVVDTFEQAIFLTDGDGGRITAIDGNTVPGGVLASPRGAVWDSTHERLYVTDATLGRVMVYNVRPLEK